MPSPEFYMVTARFAGCPPTISRAPQTPPTNRPARGSAINNLQTGILPGNIDTQTGNISPQPSTLSPGMMMEEPMTNTRLFSLLICLALAAAARAYAEEARGTVFEARNRNGQIDPGEPVVASVSLSNGREVVQTNG
jgi:hypothetical protein